MDKIPLRNLRILNEISKGHPVTQREMAKNLGIALGLANTYLKRLIRKGHIMVSSMPGNRIIYNLTPQGIAEKGQLTYEFMKYSFDHYKNVRIKFQETFAVIEKKRSRRIVFYGAGEVAEIAYISLNGSKLSLAYLVDDHKHGGKFFDKLVYPRGKLLENDFDRVVITAFSSRDIIHQRIRALPVPIAKITLVQ